MSRFSLLEHDPYLPRWAKTDLGQWVHTGYQAEEIHPTRLRFHSEVHIRTARNAIWDGASEILQRQALGPEKLRSALIKIFRQLDKAFLKQDLLKNKIMPEDTRSLLLQALTATEPDQEIALGEAAKKIWNTSRKKLHSFVALACLSCVDSLEEDLGPSLDSYGVSAVAWAACQTLILIQSPTLAKHDEEGRLHCEDGPALRYADCWEVWAWHGVRVPKFVIETPGLIPPEKILSLSCVEMRRTLIDRHGASKFLCDANAKILDEDQDSKGVRTLFHLELPNDEPLVMIRFRNAGKDGHMNTHWLRVPPDVHTCQEAVAWSFGMGPKDYKPVEES